MKLALEEVLKRVDLLHLIIINLQQHPDQIPIYELRQLHDYLMTGDLFQDHHSVEELLRHFQIGLLRKNVPDWQKGHMHDLWQHMAFYNLKIRHVLIDRLEKEVMFRKAFYGIRAHQAILSLLQDPLVSHPTLQLFASLEGRVTLSADEMEKVDQIIEDMDHQMQLKDAIFVYKLLIAISALNDQVLKALISYVHSQITVPIKLVQIWEKIYPNLIIDQSRKSLDFELILFVKCK